MNRKVTLLLTVLLILSVLAQMTAASGLAQEETPTPEAAEGVERVYRDPQGRFTVPIPTNWAARQAEGYGVLTGPNEESTIYVLTLPGEDIEAAIEEAWQIVNPSFDLSPEQVTELPPASGVEQTLSITYETEDESRFVQGAGRLYEDTVYLILLETQLSALQQRSSQVNVIQSGYSITALEQIDLSETEPLPLTGEMLADFESYIEEVRERFNVPGVAVAVVQGDEIVYTNGFGVRDFDTGQPITPETQMMIGSTTKTFTTMLMADLVDEGLMNWDTPAVELLPSFSLADPELTEQIEVRHLVCNCTGVSRRDTELLFNAADMTAEDIIDSLDTFEIFTDFGEAFQYSNQMIATGGYAAAAAAGGEYGNLYDAYADALQQRVLTPISMTQTTLSFTEVQTGENYATPYGLNLDLEYYPLPLSVEEFVEPVAPAGGLWSTVSDMGRYLLTELNRGVAPNGERVVSADNLERTWQPQVQVSADTSYGLGWFVGEYKGQRMIYHPGGTFGFTSDLIFLPDAGLGLAILANGRDTTAFNQAVRYRLLELAFDQPSEYDSQATFVYEQRQQQYAELRADLADTLDPDAVAPYLGHYYHPALEDVTLTLSEDAQMLVIDVGEFKGEFRPVADQPGRFVAYAAPAMTGIPIQLTGAEEKEPQLIFGVGLGVAEYIFEKVAEIEEVTFSRQQEIPAPVERALASLSQGVRENVTFADLAGLEWIPRQFANASLGCPRPGRSYAEVVTPGYQVWLTYAGTTYDYRVAEDGEQVILCDTRPAVPTEPSPPQEQPAVPCGEQYVVEENDTLFQIAQQCNTTVTILLRANPAITDPARIFPGQTLTLPDGGQPRSVSIQPDSGPPGTTIQVFASGFPPGAQVEMGLGPPASEYVVVGTREIGADGELVASLQISPDIQPPEKRVAVVVQNNQETVSEVFTVTDGQPTPAPTPTQPPNSLFEQAQIYLVALGDAGRSGQAVGCDDSLVPVTVTFEPTQTPLTAALQELFAIDSRTYGQSGLYNAFYQSDLAVEGIDIENGKAIINLSGTLRPGGVCDEPRMEGQIKQTALQFDTIDEVSIFLNGSPLSEAF